MGPRPLPKDAACVNIEREGSILSAFVHATSFGKCLALLRGGRCPHLFTPPFPKTRVPPPPLALPPSLPLVPFSSPSSMQPVGLLRPWHVVFPHQYPSTTATPACLPCWLYFEHHINHYEPLPLAVRNQCSCAQNTTAPYQ